jgi:NAD(P)-dependent dehydrogenase (short-subunit alcohol dehydrogenase family)
MGTEQKVVVITGASQGFGAELVKAYRDRNYRVVANSRSIKPSSDPDILVVPGDIADPATAQRIVSQALARFGRIDTLVNNAKKTTPRSLRSISEASSTSPNASR